MSTPKKPSPLALLAGFVGFAQVTLAKILVPGTGDNRAALVTLDGYF